MADVLDTSALLAWPFERVSGGYCVESQLAEVQRHSPERAMLLEVQGPQWLQASPDSLSAVKEAAAETGDLPRLSPVDIELLALAHGLGAEAVLHSDDYRMQNVARKMGIEWRAVSVKASKAAWRWELRCVGCRARTSLDSGDEGNIPDCGVCGSPQQLKRSKR